MIGARLLAILRPGRLTAIRRSLAEEIARAAAMGRNLGDALLEVSHHHPNRSVAKLAAQLGERLRAGMTLAEAGDEWMPWLGDELLVMARVAQRVVDPSRAFSSLAEVLAASEAAADRVRMTWIGPSITIALTVVVAGASWAGPIPALLALRGSALPPALGGISSSPAIGLLVGLGALVGIAVVGAGLLATAAGRRLRDALPLVGPIRRAERTAHVCRIFELLIPVGVTPIEAFRIAAGLVPAGDRREEFALAGLRLAAGEPLPAAVVDVRFLSPMFRALLERPSTRERMAEGFGKLAEFHRAEVERLGRQLRQVSEAIALLTAGLFVATISIAMWWLYFDGCGRFVE